MQEKKRKFPLSIPEVVFLIILIPVIFYVAMRIFIKPMNSPDMPDWFFGPLGPLIVIGFDVLWIIGMRILPLKNMRVKIYPTLFVLTLSVSALASWALLKLLSDMW